MSVVVGLLLAAEGRGKEGDRPHSAHTGLDAAHGTTWTAHLLLCCVLLLLLLVPVCA